MVRKKREWGKGQWRGKIRARIPPIHFITGCAGHNYTLLRGNHESHNMAIMNLSNETTTHTLCMGV